jgi:hypothetical protein
MAISAWKAPLEFGCVEVDLTGIPEVVNELRRILAAFRHFDKSDSQFESGDTIPKFEDIRGHNTYFPDRAQAPLGPGAFDARDAMLFVR